MCCSCCILWWRLVFSWLLQCLLSCLSCLLCCFESVKHGVGHCVLRVGASSCQIWHVCKYAIERILLQFCKERNRHMVASSLSAQTSAYDDSMKLKPRDTLLAQTYIRSLRYLPPDWARSPSVHYRLRKFVALPRYFVLQYLRHRLFSKRVESQGPFSHAVRPHSLATGAMYN